MTIKHGLQVRDQTNRLILEIGSHLVREHPHFAEQIGCIAAAWSQAEVNLNCLFAVLLNTTPSEAKRQLKSYRNAAVVTAGARKIAADLLPPIELDPVIKILDRLDLVRQRRNRVQHDTWANNGVDAQRLFPVQADQYLAFTTRFVAAAEQDLPEDEKSERLISIANDFALSIENGFAVQDLQQLANELNAVSASLMEAMLRHITLRMSKTASSLEHRVDTHTLSD